MEGKATPVQEHVTETPVPAPPDAAPAEEKPGELRGAMLPRARDLRAARPSGTIPHLALPALATAVLLNLCYFPVAWGWLGWVALVPLLCLVRAEASRRRLFLVAWLGGAVFFFPILRWMPVADYRMYYTWAMLATYCSLYFPVALVLLRRLDRGTRLPLVVTLPAVWVALEFVRSFLLTGFAWYYLGHTQHDYLAMIQVADLGGVYLVSALVVAVNAFLFELLFTCAWFRGLVGLPGGEPTSIRWRVVQGGVVFGLVLAALGYGAYRLSETPFTPGPHLATLQGNLEQRYRNAADLVAGERKGVDPQALVFDHFENLSLYAKLLGPDLVIWPETSYPSSGEPDWEGWWGEIAPDVPLDRVSEEWQRRAAATAEWMRRYAQGDYEIEGKKGKIRPPAANVLIGLNYEVLVRAGERPDKFNSALLVYADGSRGGRYDKIHRVPFGEYVPFRDWFPFMDAFAPYDYDYSIRSGEGLRRLKLGRHHFGVLICFEDTDPFLARDYGRETPEGPAVDFLVNISNDGWFDGSSEHDEHLAIARFRAIEARRSTVRAVNMGISALIDGNGRVLAPTHVSAVNRDGQMLNRVGDSGLAWVDRPTIGGRLKLPTVEWEAFRIIQEQVTAADPKVTLLWQVLPGATVRDLPVRDWHLFKKVRGVFLAPVPIDGRASLYSRWGDWLPLGCCSVVVLGLVWVRLRRRRMPRLEGATP